MSWNQQGGFDNNSNNNSNNYSQQQQQFSGSQFGGGGGFVQEDASKAFGSQPSFTQSQSPDAARKRDEQTLVPVTIKQLQSAESRDSKFKVDGKDISQITLVGAILSVESQPTNINYLVDDGSGKINVRLYVDMDQDAKAMEVGTYVRVVGNLRQLNGQQSVVGFQLLPITDFNEVTFHALEVINTHLRNTRGAAAGGQKATQPIGGGNMQNNAQQLSNGNNMNAGAGVIDANGGFSNANTSGSASVNDQVMAVFNQDNADAGTHVDAICQALPQMQRADIMKAIEYLSDEGHLYSTIDEQHFKSTAAA